MPRTTKTWTISLPPKLVKEAKQAAKQENRTKSELVREALGCYLEERRWRKLQKTSAEKTRNLGISTEDDVDRLVHDVRR